MKPHLIILIQIKDGIKLEMKRIVWDHPDQVSDLIQHMALVFEFINGIIDEIDSERDEQVSVWKSPLLLIIIATFGIFEINKFFP